VNVVTNEKNRPLAILASFCVAGLLIAAWQYGWFDGGNYNDDPQVAELEKERDKVFANLDEMQSEERREQRRALEEKAKGLTPQQQMALFESSMPLIIPFAAKRFEKEYDEFMAKSPEEQRKELDKRINEMEARANRPPSVGSGAGNRGPRPEISQAKRDELRKKMLDWTTPEQRAKFENGINMVNQRRKERGLSPMKGPGGRGFF
jgi:hypothetical protein